MKLHKHQQAILDLLKERQGDLRGMSLRAIGEAIGVGDDRAQVVSHHIDRLEAKGYIRRTKAGERLFEIPEKPTEEVVFVDLYKATAQCGPDGCFGDDEIIDRIPLSSKTFGITNPDDFFLIKTRGPSMEPMIKAGDLVLARKQQDIENGQIAVVVHEGMPKVKKVTKTDNSYVLSSLNNAFNDQEVVANDDENFRICGRVKGILNVH